MQAFFGTAGTRWHFLLFPNRHALGCDLTDPLGTYFVRRSPDLIRRYRRNRFFVVGLLHV